MGYILPVNHYQYQDYQKRTIPKQRSPFVLHKVYKATLDCNLTHSKNPNNQERQDSLTKTLHTSMEFHAGKSSGIREKIYSELTGKGQNFSETI
ncbi:hypothetical protein [Halobacillus mangrovi]|uniref:Uncharacterized protein n=1 Tax=Halobacillus mangrovi TaxID=402384 RepID=A0A1W5ZXL8_9BACI|nr:hypothetical protein [Halobacillus mangrovi]ARI77997.1 hypothetical protein HM131_14570 [Halobacillus mangrovi]